ncbi:alpha/beta hydrolase-fold protein [soil metagenome]
MDAFLRMDILDGPFVGVVYTLALGALLFLAARLPSRRWIVTALVALLVGAVAAFVVLWWVRATNAFGVDLDVVTTVWVVVTFSAICLAIVNLWKSVWPRKVVASIAIVVFLAAGTVGINADFGLDRTVADLAGIATQKPIALPPATPTPSRTPLAGGALWANWVAAQGQPAEGTIGSVIIPNTRSGFRSRPAGLYLPPAALAKNPPLLPLVVMLMGQPGNPDPSFQKPILDAFAARHNGLAPIVLVVDQLGNPAIDPLCLDTVKHGKSETFLVEDTVAWARANLHVLPDAAHWTIAGYSNGGECALSLGSKHPEIWGNVLDISGEEYPGSDRPNQTLKEDFAGNKAAYQSVWPTTILASHHYPDTFGIFTVGSNDGNYVNQARRAEAAAKASGWKTTYFGVLNGGHVLGALNGGLQEGYRLLYPRLGLSDPSATP